MLGGTALTMEEERVQEQVLWQENFRLEYVVQAPPADSDSGALQMIFLQCS